MLHALLCAPKLDKSFYERLNPFQRQATVVKNQSTGFLVGYFGQGNHLKTE